MNDSGFGAGEPPIHFLAHQQRKGVAGASEDFEQMLGLLVQAHTGEETNLVQANPGDWGIDVLVGNLNDRVSIWQAKYFVKEFGESQKAQVRKSFQSALKYASDKKYDVERWVLCVPCSMDPPALRWWHSWRRQQQAATGIRIELWDENELRRLLSSPKAADLRRLYYHPYREIPIADDSSSVPYTSTVPVRAPWRGGEEQRLGDELYLLYDDASETTDPGRSWSWLVATADRVEPTSERVRLRRLCLLRDTPEATELAQAVRAQAALLSAAAGEAGLPLLLGVHERPDTVTVVSRLPLGPTWHEVFGPGNSPLDRLTAAAVLDAAARLCDTLDTLHRRRHAHRALSPDAIVMVGRSRDPMLRDIGLAAIPARQGEVPAAYRAPEQARGGPHLSAPGPHTDLYQVAALAYHTLTGHSPSPMASPPVRAGLPGFPADLDDVLARALDQDPRRRPGGIRSLGAALRRGRKELSRGGRP
ncbi:MULTISPECIES: hypothetical protein [unclassified Streptosporangium]|uniref:hypothetical protein n=1 Tax=unclassified Streptosporangium TaxID=2632669 RepID=UPI002E2C6F21|nr:MULTISPECIES: hypothetical protein [unclassified Streptosporangium]